MQTKQHDGAARIGADGRPQDARRPCCAARRLSLFNLGVTDAGSSSPRSMRHLRHNRHTQEVLSLVLSTMLLLRFPDDKCDG